MGRAEGGVLRVEVVASLGPRLAEQTTLTLPQGSTVADALAASGFAAPPGGCGVWRRRCAPDTLLADGDRVELYRALQVDPKEARRRRQAGQPRAGRGGAAVKKT